jgi:hypothetical protein
MTISFLKLAVLNVPSVLFSNFNFFFAVHHEDGLMHFGEMMLRVSELALINMQHITTISEFLMKHPDLEVPQMFKEMFFSD